MPHNSALQTLLSSFEQVATSLVIKKLIQLLARADMEWLSKAQAASSPEISAHYYDAVRDLTLYRNHIELQFTENLHREFSRLNVIALNKPSENLGTPSALPTNLALERIADPELASSYAILCARLSSLGFPQLYLDDFPLRPTTLARLFAEIIDSVAMGALVKKILAQAFSVGLVQPLHSTYQQLTSALEAIPQQSQTKPRTPLESAQRRSTANPSPDQTSTIPPSSTPIKPKNASTSPEWTGIESHLTLEDYQQHLRTLAEDAKSVPPHHPDRLARSFQNKAATCKEMPLESVAPPASIASIPPPEPYLDLIRTLAPGDWIEVVVKNKWTRMRLSWISKTTASYFFVDERRVQFLQKTEAALLAGLKNQEVSLLGKASPFVRPSSGAAAANSPPLNEFD